MNDLKYLVFTEHLQAFSRVYRVKNADSRELLFWAVPASVWQTSLDVFKGEASARQKAFTIRPHDLFSLTHNVINQANNVLGSVKQQGLLSRDWLIRDAQTGIVANLCRRAVVIFHGFGGEYQIKVDERVVCTLSEKHNFFTRSIDLNYRSDFTNSFNDFNESLLTSTALLILVTNGGSGGGAYG